ncbi:helix-turn-helix domain-containing protein [Thalassotalea sp. PS06]|uniref:helix-turn-helix domain-containing protein n=1 Tax=Thalassotalea sp. PS06 TaxID=2594005 RepID=UPI001C8F65D3|nr:helix-turn-helix domain-containing protein [Thalassotalea sp. PS06]
MPKRLNPNRIKKYRSYTIQEAAYTLDIHKNTVARWIKYDGLPIVDNKRPYLIRGTDLKTFIRNRNTEHKKPCGLGEFFCCKCRQSRSSSQVFVEVYPTDNRTGVITGFCNVCSTKANKFINQQQFKQLKSKLGSILPMGEIHIDGGADPRVNGAFKDGE